MGNNDSGGVWKALVMLIIFILLAGILFWGFGDNFDKTRAFHEKWFGEAGTLSFTSDMAEPRELVLPPRENVWCKIQEVQVGADREQPIRDRIVGWDSVDNCCVREVTGYSCAVGKETTLQYCYTANIGGEVKYVQVDGYIADKNFYSEFVDDLDKFAIPNKPVCDIEKYPQATRGVN